MSVTSGYRSKREVYEYAGAMLEGAAMMERHKVDKAQEGTTAANFCSRCEEPISRWDNQCRDCANGILLEQQAEMAEWEHPYGDPGEPCGL